MKQWFAVQTRPRHEARAEDHLHRQGYEVYCPRIRCQRRQRGRWRAVIEPLFPRYLFVRLAQGRDNFGPVRSTLGVRDFVRFGGVPGRVPAEMIAGIRAAEDSEPGIIVEQPLFHAGDGIEIVSGPFAGMYGIIQAVSGEERVVILLQWLGRENRITITTDHVALI